MKNLIIGSFLIFVAVAQPLYAICPDWTSKKVGLLDKNVINEASGLVASKLRPGKLIWSNDSGGDSALYATNSDGKLIKTVKLTNFKNTDFEAIASGPCPSNQADTCLYVGDIGDGIGWRSSFQIGIFKESDFWTSQSITAQKIIKFSYPGSANNAEALIVTPEGKILTFTKTEGSTQIFNLDINGKATKVAQIDLNPIVAQARGKAARITDASLSRDGDKVLMLTYGDILEVNLSSILGRASRTWVKGVDYSLAKGLNLPQQETITYTSENSFIVSTESSGGNEPEIYSYSCK